MTDSAFSPCPICEAPDPRVRYRITRFTVLGCRRCRQIYLWPLPSPEEIRDMFARLYTSGDRTQPELKEYYSYCYEDEPTNPLVQQYEHWLGVVEAHRGSGRLLDVGCGTGLFLSVARRRGWEVYGIDDSVEATSHARDHFGLDVFVGEFGEFGDELGQFDAITGWDIIEHSRDPIALLETVRASLAPDGVVVLSTPNQRNMIDIVAGALYTLTAGRFTTLLEKFYIEQHFLYFTPKSLTAALSRAGLATRQLDLEETQLSRLVLSPVMRLGLQTLFAVARPLGYANRLLIVGGRQ